jgi:hypothetical protein
MDWLGCRTLLLGSSACASAQVHVHPKPGIARQSQVGQALANGAYIIRCSAGALPTTRQFFRLHDTALLLAL